MMGIEGTYIKRRISGRDSFEYAIEPTLDQPTCEISLQQMVTKILPMCSHHDEVEFYVASKSKFDNGRISQALCSALNILTKEYITMINQLDNEFNNGELTLQKLWYYLQPSIKVMQALHNLTSETMNLNGGALLSKIYDLINSNTDRQVISVYTYLVEKAFTPYAQQLEKWLFTGEIEDTFGEFLIQEK
jgi:gamma-tubulin complex component 2